MTQSHRLLGASFLLLFSLWLLRLGFVDLDIKASLVSLGLPKGMILDTALVLLIAAVAQAGGVISPRLKCPLWILLAIYAWGMSFSNYAYFGFFKSPLEWWVIAAHWNIIPSIADVGGGMALAPLPLISTAVFILSCAWVLLPMRQAMPPGQKAQSGQSSKSNPSRFKAVGSAAALLMAALLLNQSPVWMRNLFPTPSILSYSAGIEISKTLIRSLSQGGSTTLQNHTLGQSEVQKTLASLADQSRKISQSEKDAKSPWPLYRKHQPSHLLTARLRKELGLPRVGPINVVIVFGESLRHYEVAHPEYRDTIFPKLNALASKHAVQFTQAYHSARNAGLTARGQFSTLCSMYPNFDGVAAYIGFENLKLQCLMNVFKTNGYQTLWISSHDRTFFNKLGFESRHGTNLFFDWSYAGSKGVQSDHGWGLEDPKFFETYFPVFDEYAKKGSTFAHFTTTGTHTPFRIKPDGPIPEHLQNHGDYSGFLSRLSAADKGISLLIEKIFAAPYADRTLVVVLGDHGIFTEPREKLTLMQSREIFFRIPLFFMTKNMPQARKESFPVHQVDVAPTLTDIAGYSHQASWMGRNILDGKKQGSPWIFEDLGKISYRHAERGCWNDRDMPEPVCFDLSDRTREGEHPDPLFTDDLDTIDMPQSEAARYHRAARAVSAGIEMNWLEP